MQAAATAHIHLDERGIPWIDETNVKVIEVVLEQLGHGSSAAEIHFQHPHLSLAHAPRGHPTPRFPITTIISRKWTRRSSASSKRWQN